MNSILSISPEVSRGKSISMNVLGSNGFNTSKGYTGVKPNLNNLKKNY